MKRTSYFILSIPVVLMAVAVGIVIYASTGKVRVQRLYNFTGSVARMDSTVFGRGLRVDDIKDRNSHPSYESLGIVVTVSDAVMLPTLTGPDDMLRHVTMRRDADTLVVAFDWTDAGMPDLYYYYWEVKSSEPLTITLPAAPEFVDMRLNSVNTLDGITADSLTLSYSTDMSMDGCRIKNLMVQPTQAQVAANSNRGGWKAMQLYLQHTDVVNARYDLEWFDVMTTDRGGSAIGDMYVYLDKPTQRTIDVGVDISVGHIASACQGSYLRIGTSGNVSGTAVEYVSAD
ncbi:MAG: hypothetical protein NC043_06780 [Muribaculaceae bacterium]|nr:hypothetical protein [Muribaculaceae bacterium]